MLRTKRVYEAPAADDGLRVLTDRLWPRGLSKAEAHIDLWLKDVAPSNELRKWFGHDPARWAEFQTRYMRELEQQPARAALEQLRDCLNKGRVTLLYAARDETHNNARVLQDYLQHHRRAG